MSDPTSKSPNWVLRLAIVAGILLVVGLGVSYALRPVAQVMPAIKGKSVRFVPGTIEVKAEYEIELKSEVSGRVSSTELEIGKKVARNDVLIQIDTGDVDIDIERFKNEITAARKKVELRSTLRQLTMRQLEAIGAIASWPQQAYVDLE